VRTGPSGSRLCVSSPARCLWDGAQRWRDVARSWEAEERDFLAVPTTPEPSAPRRPEWCVQGPSVDSRETKRCFRDVQEKEEVST